MKIYSTDELAKMSLEEAFWKVNDNILPRDKEEYSNIKLGLPIISTEYETLFKVINDIGILFYWTHDWQTNDPEKQGKKKYSLKLVDFQECYDRISEEIRVKNKRKELTEKYGKNE